MERQIGSQVGGDLGRRAGDSDRGSRSDYGPAGTRRGDRDAGRRVSAAAGDGSGGVAGDAGAVLARLGEAVGRETVERYLGRSTRLEVDGEGVRVRASSRFAAEMIERRLGAALRAASGSGSVRFEVEAGEAADAGSGGVAGRAAVGGEIAAPARRFNTGANTGAARGGPRSSRGRVRSGDPSQTLGGFVVGGCNRFAFAAISRVAEDEGAVSGPVFLHGPCGVGKTHLLNAAANRFREVRPGGRVRVVTAESFTNEYISAIRSNTIESFHRVYRRVDLLCIDDVHFLATKSGTQQELLHTFDHLCGAGGRIVLASDAHPGTVRQFSEALVSRFVSGSLVKIGAPEAETRRRLVAHFSRAAGLSLTREAAGVLEASAVAGAGTRPVSVRDLAGAVNRLRAFRSVVAAGDGEVGAAEVEAAIRAQGGVVPGRAVSSGSGRRAGCGAERASGLGRGGDRLRVRDARGDARGSRGFGAASAGGAGAGGGDLAGASADAAQLSGDRARDRAAEPLDGDHGVPADRAADRGGGDGRGRAGHGRGRCRCCWSGWRGWCAARRDRYAGRIGAGSFGGVHGRGGFRAPALRSGRTVWKPPWGLRTSL
jgi:chromosomal replication initiator protein DnaA